VYAFARDRFLPAVLATIHPRTRAPHVAIVVQSVLTLALALTGSFEKLAMLANICALAVYFGCAIAAWRLRTVSASVPSSGFASRFADIVPWLACAAILWLLTGVTRDEWFAFGGCVTLASILYAVSRRRSSPV